MKSNVKVKDAQLSFVALAIGVGATLLSFLFGDMGSMLAFVLFVLLTFIYAKYSGVVPWKLSFLMLGADFLASLFFLPNWGELLPINAVLVIISWGICGLAGSLGVRQRDGGA